MAENSGCHGVGSVEVTRRACGLEGFLEEVRGQVSSAGCAEVFLHLGRPSPGLPPCPLQSGPLPLFLLHCPGASQGPR